MPDSFRENLEADLEVMLCPNAQKLAAQANLGYCADGMLHCGECGQPVVLRFGRVSLHGPWSEGIMTCHPIVENAHL